MDYGVREGEDEGKVQLGFIFTDAKVMRWVDWKVGVGGVC